MSRIYGQQDALHDITQGARRLAQKLGPVPNMRRSQPELLPHHLLNLPMPRHIVSLFITRGYAVAVAEKLNEIFLTQATSLKRMYEDKHRDVVKTWLDVSSSPSDMDRFIVATHSAYTYQYDEDMKIWLSKIDEMAQRNPPSISESNLADRGSVGVKYDAERRPTFKNENVPLLEKAYCVNPYPSRADKESLAVDTGMEYKQINIWFQNRRARSKKEGTTLQRTATFATQFHSPRRMTPSPPAGRFASACEEKCSTQSSEVRASSLINTALPEAPFTGIHVPSDVPGRPNDFLTLISRPAHAFPTPYPPFYDEEPFPVRSGTGSFPTYWVRKCATGTIPIPCVDMEQLTASMANLSLSSDAPSSRISHLPSFTLVLPCAPLPALIRTATALSSAQPVSTRVSVAGSSSGSRSRERRRIDRTSPTRLPRSIDRQASPLSLLSATNTRPISIQYSRASSARQTQRSETRSPSPSHSSRSSSLSSLTSSRSISSSWSIASSVGPLTPGPASPRIEVLTFTECVSRTPSSPHAHPSDILDCGHIFH